VGTSVWIIIGVLIALTVVFGWGFSRLRRLSTQVGLFDCAYRAGSASLNTGDRWTQGLCEYQSDRLLWWRILSLSFTANKIWMREEFELTGRVPLDQADLPGLYLVQCRYQGVPFELMMSAEAYHGLASWVESAPPQTRGYVF